MKREFYVVGWRPGATALLEMMLEAQTHEARMRAVVPAEDAERIVRIAKQSETWSQTGIYRAVEAAALYGEDFSKANTLQDIEDIYAVFCYKQAAGIFGGCE